MFSTFDQAKEELRKQYQEHHWDPESGLDGETLEANCRELLSHSEGKSGLRKKTDLLCYLLRNARVENPDFCVFEHAGRVRKSRESGASQESRAVQKMEAETEVQEGGTRK